LKIAESLEGLTLYDAYVMERMFETFADFRCEADSNSKMPMPSIEQTFIRAKKCTFRSKLVTNKEVIISRFQEVLAAENIPIGRPNRYSYRKRLRQISCFLYDVLTDIRQKQSCSEQFVLTFKDNSSILNLLLSRDRCNFGN